MTLDLVITRRAAKDIGRLDPVARQRPYTNARRVIRNSPMNIFHATIDPPLLQRLKEMPGSSARADIDVGYFFVSGFEQARSVIIKGGR